MIKKIALVVIVLAGSWLAHGLILTAGMALAGASVSLAEITGAWFLFHVGMFISHGLVKYIRK